MSTTYTKVNWDDLVNASVPRPEGYDDRHPWPTNTPYVSRVYSGRLGCEHVAFTIAHLQPGQSGEHHRHREAEEMHVLIRGSCQMMIGDEIIEARELDAIRVPPEVYRSFHNHSDEDCWWLVMAAPVGEFLEASPDYHPPTES